MSTLLHTHDFTGDSNAGPNATPGNTTSWGSDGATDIAGNYLQIRSGGAQFTNGNGSAPSALLVGGTMYNPELHLTFVKTNMSMVVWFKDANGVYTTPLYISRYDSTRMDINTIGLSWQDETVFNAADSSTLYCKVNLQYAGANSATYTVIFSANSDFSSPLLTNARTVSTSGMAPPFRWGISGFVNPTLIAISSYSTYENDTVYPVAYSTARAIRNTRVVPFHHRAFRPIGNATKGSVTEATTQAWYRAVGTITNPRVVYANMKGSNTVGENIINVHCSLEYPIGGTRRQMFFGGQITKALDPGGRAFSDPFGTKITAGDLFCVHTHFSVASSGLKWPGNYATGYQVTGSIDNYKEGADYTLSGSYTPGDNDIRFGPIAILGDPIPGVPTVLWIGDSIAAGQGGTPSLGSFAHQGFDSTIGYNFINTATPGETLANVAADLTSYAGYHLFDTLPTHMILSLGINDAAASDYRDLVYNATKILSYYASLGVVPFLCTLTPQAASTDSWATLVNQTTTSINPVRVLFNNAVRAGLTPARGYLEIADSVESSRDSGKWKVTGSANGYATDQTHPSPGGHLAMSVVVNAFAVSGSLRLSR